MKHLTNPTAPRFLLWTILCIFLLAIAGPGTILAGGIEYTSGSGMVEGDPTDGLDYSGGGNGLGDVFDGNQQNETPITPEPEFYIGEIFITSRGYFPLGVCLFGLYPIENYFLDSVPHIQWGLDK